MDDGEKFEQEETELLDKIDALKKQIKNFENELGINTDDLISRPYNVNNKVVQKVKESEKQVAAIENSIKNDNTFIKPQKIGPDNQIVEQAPELPPPARRITFDEIQKRAVELKKKSDQVAQISSMVSSLKPNSAVDKKEEQKTDIQPAYSVKDIPSLGLMVQKLNELVKENAEISEELREMINETKNSNKASKVTGLVRKLALAGLNG